MPTLRASIFGAKVEVFLVKSKGGAVVKAVMCKPVWIPVDLRITRMGSEHPMLSKI